MENPLFEIFVEEAEDNLEILESRIISIEQNPHDKERINEAFRAIHSLKGGAGLAGFNKVKDFAHKAEDLFENIRNGSLNVTGEIISLLLEILDVLKIMIDNIKGEKEANDGIETDELLARMSEFYEGSAAAPVEKQTASDTEQVLYYLRLEYYPEIFRSGIDPLMFLNDLRSAGEIIDTELITHELTDAADFNPENLYLSWQLFYLSPLDQKAIEDIFCFVIDESSIEIISLTALASDHEKLKSYRVNNKDATTLLSKVVAVKDGAEPEQEKAGYRRVSDMNTSSYIRVPTEKLENIFNTVSELIVSQARISMLSEEYEESLPDNFIAVTDMLRNITQILQEQVTSLRMISLSGTFDRFKRVVRDMASDLGKQVELEISGQETELDKNMIEKLNDPLKHLVRNCIDHGIEKEEERIKKGKSPAGLLRLAAYLEGGKVVIEIADDGQGINREKILKKAIEREIVLPNQQLTDGEILNLIFHPGLSTAENITDMSGRGGGMDVVKNAITELNGSIDIISEEGKGSSFRLFLPLTLAIMDGMLISIGAEKYIIPTLSIIEIFRPEKQQIKTVSNRGELVFFRGDYIPVIRLYEILQIEDAALNPLEAELIVINSNGMKAALFVDLVLEQYQIVIKSLLKNFRRVDNISSATILGNGDVALILDIQSILQRRK
ncbi:MAG: chemotaxis protein CheA [Spirochaetales bacterium]|nr:chemotaxis protein CheA [Spirochaetales bacterium]